MNINQALKAASANLPTPNPFSQNLLEYVPRDFSRAGFSLRNSVVLTGVCLR